MGLGEARRGSAWQGRAWRGTAGQGKVGRGVAGHGWAWLGAAGPGLARQGEAGQGKAWLGEARRGRAWLGRARLGGARRGGARQGKEYHRHYNFNMGTSMTAPAAIKGTFADFKIIKTRKLAQLVIEIPIEQGDAALAALGGLPQSDKERWVGIARLEMPTLRETIDEIRAVTKKHGITLTPDERFDPDENDAELPTANDVRGILKDDWKLHPHPRERLEVTDSGDVFARRAFCDLPYPTQAGIKSNDVSFQLWMSVNYPAMNDEVDCASVIRRICGVDSRAHILPGTKAVQKWIELLREYDGRSR